MKAFKYYDSKTAIGCSFMNGELITQEDIDKFPYVTVEGEGFVKPYIHVMEEPQSEGFEYSDESAFDVTVAIRKKYPNGHDVTAIRNFDFGTQADDFGLTGKVKDLLPYVVGRAMAEGEDAVEFIGALDPEESLIILFNSTGTVTLGHYTVENALFVTRIMEKYLVEIS